MVMLSALYQKMVYLDVGPNAIRYGVHQGLISRESEFFRAALNGSYEEARSGIIKLQDDDAGIVGLFVDWLYTRRLVREIGDGTEKRSSIRSLIHLYIFAGARLVPRLQQDIANQLAKSRFIVNGLARTEFLAESLQWIKIVYEKLPETTPLRRWLVDMFIYKNSQDNHTRSILLQWGDECPKDFIIDVAHDWAQMNGKKKVAPWRRTRCRYHPHNSNECCESDSDSDSDSDMD